MGNLTADQAIQVAGVLHQLSNSIGAYVITNQGSIEPDTKADLISNQRLILDDADDLLDYASDLVFTDVDQQLTDLNSINAAIAEKLKVLGDVQNVLDITADLVHLTEAIITFDPKTIATSTGDILGKLGVKVKIG